MLNRKSLALAVAFMLAAVPVVADDERPFKGEALSELVSFDYATMSAVWKITEGSVTHLGRVTGEGTVYYDPVTWMPTGAVQTLIAANGDELYITATTDTYTIAGGTGRFAGASGSGSLTAVNVGDPADDMVAVSWAGSITY
ncbi:MAG: hypothetical protein ACYTGV_01380 [Planctomycetota bacterium]|jgi:hypothetical protein